MNDSFKLLRRTPVMGAALFAGLAVGCGNAEGESETSAAGSRPIFSVDAPAPVFQGSPEAFRDAHVEIAVPDETLDVPEDDAVGDELVNKGPIQVTKSGNAEIFSWSTGGRTAPDTVMRPSSTHVCVLSRLGGEIHNASVGIHHSTKDSFTLCNAGDTDTLEDDLGPTWKIGGCQGSSNSLSAEAICAPGSNFTTDPGGTVTGSQVFSMPNLQNSLGCKPTDAPMWPGLAVSFLSGVAGDFRGGGEFVKIIPAPGPFDPALLHFESHTGGCSLDGDGYSLFAGVLNGTHVTRRGNTQVSVSTENGPKSKTLGSTKDTLCYLTRVSGDFRGAEERIRIGTVKDSWGVEWWQLSVHAGRGKVYGTAECVFYNQSTIILE